MMAWIPAQGKANPPQARSACGTQAKYTEERKGC